MLFRALLVLSLGVVFPGAVARAAVYPLNQCVATKQAEAGRYCRAALSTWGAWLRSQDDAARDAGLGRSADLLAGAWADAESRSLRGGSDCADTTLSATEAAGLMDDAIAEIVSEIADGLEPGPGSDAQCGGRLLDAAAEKCEAVLKAEGRHVRRLAQDADGSRLARTKERVSWRFQKDWGQATRSGCPTTATEASIESRVDALSADVVYQTVVSPNLDDSQFTTVSPTGPVSYLGMELEPGCVFDTPYHFFAKRGSVNKLLMYYQGGGACWEQLTCAVPVCDAAVNPEGGDNPNNFSTGFADLSNPENPFRDWNIVFVSYCSCDIHFGNASQDYDNVNPSNPLHVEHRGYHNARIAEKWAREHFVDPDVVFVTGSSAGAYGAIFHGPVLQLDPWPASQFHVLGDAGNGVITPDFLQNEFENWNFRANLPSQLPELVDPIDDGSGMVGYVDLAADFFPNANWAHYSTAFDGGTGGQTGFYNVMLNDSNPIAALTWWEGSCAFNEVMRSQAFETAALQPDNYRYYIGSGSRHTMWGSDKVYSDTTGGVPTIVDWVKAMLSNLPGAPDPNWRNVEADPFNVLLPGDVRPAPNLQPPFEMVGTDVVVSCP